MNTPAQQLQSWKDEGLLRRLKNIDCLPNGLARLDNGKILVNWASNDYLGLAQHPALAEAIIEGVKRFGAGAMASRLVTGTRSVHTQLEERLAELKGAEAALSFSSGYATSVGVIGAVVRKGDIVILDKLSHASLIDGARLSGAELHTFLHNNTESLRKQLERFRAKDANQRILIVTESVFSMDGDRAPLKEIAELKDQYGALLLVDEAHAFGVLGDEGAGLASELGVSSQIDFQMGTLSKSAGLSGGYVACTREWADVLINSSRSFIYSTAPAPALAFAAIKAVDLIAGDEGKKLRHHVQVLADLFTELMNFPHRPLSSIFPYIIGENEAALAVADQLIELGHLAPAIRYPTVPKGTARLRLTITAANSEGQVRDLAKAILATARA